MKLLVGTYSFPIAGVEGNGEGIYSVPFDAKTGAFGEPLLLAECVNPSSLALSSDGKTLFAGREVFADDGPELAAYHMAEDGALTLASRLPIAGELPCHLAFDATHNRLASGQYLTGDVAISALDGGTLQPPSYLTRSGSGPNAGRQEGPHAHYVAFSDQGMVLHLVDLGTDSIVSHRLNAAGEATETAAVTVPRGSGPRHMVMDHTETRAWVFCELDESLITLTRDGLGWAIDAIQPGFEPPVDEDGSGAAIRLSPDGKHLYLSGRRQSKIAGFTSDGAQVGTFDCGGDSPRDFVVTPDGSWIISANQTSNTLTSMRRDLETGALAQPANNCAIGSPVALIAT